MSKSLKLKVPPLVQVTIFGLLVLLAHLMLPFPSLKIKGQLALSVGIMIIAIVIQLWGVFDFRRAKTSVDPLHPEKASKLVIFGIYRFTRNPMYLGMLLMLVAWSLYLGSLASPLIVGFFVWYITQYQIKPEERVLEGLFGEQYLEYMRNVRRWI